MTSEHPLNKYGLFFFIIGTMIGFAAVNELSLSIIPYLRFFGLALAALVLLLYLSDLKVSCCIILSFGITLFLNWYGLTRGLENLGQLNYLPQLITSTIVTLT